MAKDKKRSRLSLIVIYLAIFNLIVFGIIGFLVVLGYVATFYENLSNIINSFRETLWGRE